MIYNTIIELPEIIRKSEKLLMADERSELLLFLSANPSAGVLIEGTGGIRKLRWARKGKGKSGGLRIIYYYYNRNVPLFLLTAFGKNEKDNLSKSERNSLKLLTELLIKNYGIER